MGFGLSARHVARVFGAAVVTAGAVVMAAPMPSASAQPCPDVEVVFARGTAEPPGVGGVGPPGQGGLDLPGHTGAVALIVPGLAGPEAEFRRFQHRLDPGPVGRGRPAGPQRSEEPPGQVPPGLTVHGLIR